LPDASATILTSNAAVTPAQGGTGATATPTNGQLLVGNGTNYTVATLGTGTGISTTVGAGTLQINNTGVTSNVAGTGIGVSGATGAVTITNNGVTSNVATANQTTVSGATGAVTIGLSSTLVAPGSLQVTTSLQTSATNTISAAGTTQGTGTVLTTDYNVVTTTASGTGVVLPAGLAGRTVTVVNRGANALLVYPASGAQIDVLGANVAVSVIVNGTLEVTAISATQWYIVSNTVSGGGGAVSSVTGTSNQITASPTTGAVVLSLPSAVTLPGSLIVTTTATISGLTANSFLYSGTAGLLTTTSAPTNGQLLIGSTGAAPVAATLTGTAGNITVTNAAGSITLNLATAGTAGTYATVTTDSFGRVTSGVVTQSTGTGGTGLTAIGTANQVLGVNTGATGLEYKTVTAGSNITVTPAAAAITLAAIPSGADTQIQFNNAGAFGGDADFTWNSTTNDLVLGGTDTGITLQGITNEPAAPSAGRGHLYAKDIGGRMMPKWIGPSGFDWPFQSHVALNNTSWWVAAGNSTTITATGSAALTVTGTATAVTVATTNIYTMMRKLEHLVTVAATTAVAGFRSGVTQHRIGTPSAGIPGGFFFVCRWGPATGVATTTNRAFVGMGNSTAAPTDVEPSSITNIVGMGWDAADTNIQIMYRGAGAVTKVDLGASFPVPTADRTKKYELVLFSPNNTTQSVGYRVTDLGTGAQTSGTITTNLPTNTTLLAPRGWMSVGGTSSVIGIALTSLYIETDY
jgi:hypothetical protein